MRISLVALCFVFFSDLVLHAQVLHRPVATNYPGTGTYSFHHTDAFSFTVNPAALAQVKNFSAGMFGERRFLLSELNFFKAVAVMPTSSGHFGLKAHYSGFSEYNETILGLAYGRNLGDNVSIGAGFHFNSIRISSYGTASALCFEIGTIMHLAEKIHAGVHAYNPVGGKFGKEAGEELPSVYTFGLGYDASEKFYFSAEIIKEENRPVNVQSSLQYRLLPPLQARGGISAADGIVWLGIGFYKNNWRADVCSSFHPQLGISPGLLFIFNLQNRKNQ